MVFQFGLLLVWLVLGFAVLSFDMCDDGKKIKKRCPKV